MRENETEKQEKTEILTAMLLSFINNNEGNIDKEMLGAIKDILVALEYRNPEAVTEYIRYPSNIHGFCQTFEICPKCGAVLNRTYQEYCSTCGQRLRWIAQHKMKIKPRTND